MQAVHGEAAAFSPRLLRTRGKTHIVSPPAEALEFESVCDGAWRVGARACYNCHQPLFMLTKDSFPHVLTCVPTDF